MGEQLIVVFGLFPRAINFVFSIYQQFSDAMPLIFTFLLGSIIITLAYKWLLGPLFGSVRSDVAKKVVSSRSKNKSNNSGD